MTTKQLIAASFSGVSDSTAWMIDDAP